MEPNVVAEQQGLQENEGPSMQSSDMDEGTSAAPIAPCIDVQGIDKTMDTESSSSDNSKDVFMQTISDPAVAPPREPSTDSDSNAASEPNTSFDGQPNDDSSVSNAPSESSTSSDGQLPNDDSFREFNAKKVEEWMLSGSGNEVMFAESNLRTWQVILVILGIWARFSLTHKARQAIIDATKLFAGPRFANFDISNYYLSKIFDAPDDVTMYHYYCSTCCELLEEPTTRGNFQNHETVCKKCMTKWKLSLLSENQFISIDLKYQITSLLTVKHINEALHKQLTAINTDARCSDTMGDVYDSVLYKKLLADTPLDDTLLTYVFNTDGAPLFNSSKRAFWPILIIINELPPHLRFKYPLLAGLCVVRKEPSPNMMNMFLRPFVQQANKLSAHGFDLTMSDVGNVHFVLKPLLCSVDSVARPILQNRIQFNGYYGCSWCYAVGVYTQGCTRYIMTEDEPEQRTHESNLIDTRDAERKRRKMQATRKNTASISVRGVKCRSALFNLKYFDTIVGYIRDYLHGDLIGTTCQITTMHNDPQCPIRIMNAEMNEVNERLMEITPPHEIHRQPRPLKTEKSKWKASEWRSWLLFYAIPCWRGILDEYALQLFGLLTNAIYKLLGTNITEEDLLRTECELERFDILFELLYGERYVTFNIHSLNHLVRCVRYGGPLWATSTFPFENAIYYLKMYVCGPKGVLKQMAGKAIQANVMRSLVANMEESEDCLKLHRSLYARTEVSSYERVYSVVLLGRGKPYVEDCEDDEIPGNQALYYDRCVFMGMIIHTANYDVGNKTNDSMFIGKADNVVQIERLFSYEGDAFARVSSFENNKVLLPDVPEQRRHGCPSIGDVTIHHSYEITTKEDNFVIPVKNLVTKCVFMKMRDSTYTYRF